MRPKGIATLSMFTSLFMVELLLFKHLLNQNLDPFLLTAIVVFVGGLVLSPIFIKNAKKLTLKQYRQILIIAILASVVGISTRALGMKLTTATSASFLLALISVSTIHFAHVILRERLPKRFFSLVVLMIIGVFLITTKGQALKFNRGDLIIIFTCGIFGFSNAYATKIMRKMSPQLVTSGRLLTGGIILLVLNSIFNLGNITPFFTHYKLVILLGLIMGLRIIFFYMGMHAEGASIGASFILITYPLVAIGAYLFLGEIMTTAQITGATLVMVGAFILTRTRMIKHKTISEH